MAFQARCFSQPRTSASVFKSKQNIFWILWSRKCFVCNGNTYFSGWPNRYFSKESLPRTLSNYIVVMSTGGRRLFVSVHSSPDTRPHSHPTHLSTQLSYNNRTHTHTYTHGHCPKWLRMFSNSSDWLSFSLSLVVFFDILYVATQTQAPSLLVRNGGVWSEPGGSLLLGSA